MSNMEEVPSNYVIHRHVGEGRVCRNPRHKELIGRIIISTAPHSVLGTLGEIIETGETSHGTLLYFRVQQNHGKICEFLAISQANYEKDQALVKDFKLPQFLKSE
jgi:hypothetical protein